MSFRMLTPLGSLSLLPVRDPFASLQRDLDRMAKAFSGNVPVACGQRSASGCQGNGQGVCRHSRSAWAE